MNVDDALVKSLRDESNEQSYLGVNDLSLLLANAADRLSSLVSEAVQPVQPAPRKQITAEDVTDEMIDELARQCPTYNTVEVDRQTIAAAANIYHDMKE